MFSCKLRGSRGDEQDEDSWAAWSCLVQREACGRLFTHRADTPKSPASAGKAARKRGYSHDYDCCRSSSTTNSCSSTSTTSNQRVLLRALWCCCTMGACAMYVHAVEKRSITAHLLQLVVLRESVRHINSSRRSRHRAGHPSTSRYPRARKPRCESLHRVLAVAVP